MTLFIPYQTTPGPTHHTESDIEACRLSCLFAGKPNTRSLKLVSHRKKPSDRYSGEVRGERGLSYENMEDLAFPMIFQVLVRETAR